MRNVFDQYDQPENKLTHALFCALNNDRKLIVPFLRWLGIAEHPPASKLKVAQQTRAIACQNQLKCWLPDQLLVQIHWREIESVGCGMNLPPEYTGNRHAIALGLC